MDRFRLSLPHKVIEAANWSRQIGPQRKRWLVLHSMETAEKGDSAELVARYFARATTRASAHYCIDNDSIVQCVPPELVAWHAPGANMLGIGLEHAGYARQTPAQWSDSYSDAMLDLSARVAAELVHHFAIPVEFVGHSGLRAHRAGITLHSEVTKAWPDRGSHTDPGAGFPLNRYLERVRAYRDRGDWLRDEES